MALSQELIGFLACPRCKGEVYSCIEVPGLICPACRLKYPVRDGIPVMLIEEADVVGGDQHANE